MSLLVPRDYQTYARDTILRFCHQRPGKNGVVVMPTGTGKSLVIADLAAFIVQTWPDHRVMCLTHVQELIGQNADKMLKCWPAAPIGIHSAGLKSRDIFQPIIYGGVQTVRNAVARFGKVHVLMIDEAHLLSPNGDAAYNKIIAELREKNPHLVVIGFTATDFRRGQGRLTDGEGKVFDEVIIDMSTLEWWDWFIARGYLVPPINKNTETKIDLKGVGITNGEYNLTELAAASDNAELNWRVCNEIMRARQGVNRHKLLTFAAGVDHAEHLAATLTAMGLETKAIHSKMDPKLRAAYLAAYAAGELRSVTNNNVLTTGFDEPEVCHIACARGTVSTALWVQLLGRGTRPAEWIQKRFCFVQDFTSNTSRLGPINDPLIPRRPGEGAGEAPVKKCEVCDCFVHASLRVCNVCGAPFPIKPAFTAKANAEAEIYRGDQPVFEWFTVQRVYFADHMAKRTGNRSIRVQYHCGAKGFTEYVNFEGKGYTLHVAHAFWQRFIGTEPPLTNDDALAILTKETELHSPTRIKVHVNAAYPEIVQYEYV